MKQRFWPRAASSAFFAFLASFVMTTTALAQTATELISPTVDHPYSRKAEPSLGTTMVSPTGADDQPVQSAQQQAPEAPFDWWWVAFQSYRSNNWEIYRIHGNGTDFAQLTFEPAADTHPNLNRGVNAIVFVSARDGNSEIYRMKADGSNQIRLTNHVLTDTQPIWSPDSSQIAFVSQRDGNAELYRMNADGSAQQRLTTDSAFDLFPHWSPDGRQLVWVRAAGDSGWLWVMNCDGSNAHAISGALRYLQHPVWSPDGRTIAFDYDPDRDGFNELGILTIADGSIRLFQDWSNWPPASGQELWMGEWSPNGAGITYTAFDYFWEPASGNYVLYWERAQIGGVCMTTHCDGTVIGVNSQSSDMDLLPSVQSADYLSPQTAVDPLPVYKRRTNLFVTWSGVDQGPSGIAGYDVESRTDLNEEWQQWHNHTYLIGDYFNSVGGVASAQTVYFRSRAIDNADNMEPWPADPKGDTSVTFFATTLSGRVTDLRGVGRANHSLPLLPAGLTQVQSNVTGDYFVRLPTSGEYQINGLRISTNADRVQPFYLDPPQNQIRNGDFELFTPLEHWQTSGAITPTLTISNVSSGLQGAHLGFDCAHQCVTVDETFPQSVGATYLPLLIPDNHLHLFTQSADNKLLHLERMASGEWTAPDLLYEGGTYGLQAVGARNGNLQLAWPAVSAEEIKIISMGYTLANGWSPPVPLAIGQSPQLAGGNDGSVHLFYWRCSDYCNETLLLYRWRTNSGPWSPEIIVSKHVFEHYRAVVSQDGTVHIVWSERDPKYHDSNSAPFPLYYQTYRQGKPLGSPIIADNEGLVGMPYLDQTDTIYLFSTAGTVYYRQKSVDSSWSEVALASNYDFRHVIVAPNGVLQLLTSPIWANQPWSYRYKTANELWSTPQLLDLNSYFPQWLNVDGRGQFHAVTYEGDYIQFPPKINEGRSAIAQTVSIPADLHQPTLSWMAETQGNSLAQSQFLVTISNGLSETLLYSTSASIPWQLQWAEMTPWLGQTVTVTFAVSQAAGEIPFQLFLDHVALGAWETPVPQAVAPALVDAGVNATVVISGENFMATPQVTVGGKALTGVQLQGATLLEALIPNTLPPGVHDLVVTNPGGAVTVLPSAVKVGKQIYLPMVQR